ncbi:alpha/beta hydrolase [Amycolatopsis nigrescens]|uniref:alpha/beta hydrolase n=1 Tax=Amycolatopsis nigrescens TaxID=381445 RepID=UPI00039AF55B|nr:alpha/beta hydrolase [Amycolatopsis nigrescens]
MKRMPSRADRPKPRPRYGRLLVAAVTMAAGLTAAATGSAAATGNGPVWGPCAEPSPELVCAKLEVPLDYANPRGPKIEIGLSKLPSPRPDARRGVLLLNPGGQSGSELSFPLRLVSHGLPGSVRESYDLISFDPRGIGASTPVTCDLHGDQDLNIPPSGYAAGPADVLRRAAELREITAQCASSASARRLPHMSVANVARDMDRIRAALGEQRISYFGYSFGTYVGAVYATLFPQRTDRFVLDSVVGPGGMDHTWSSRLGRGVEERFPDFAEWAAARNGTYHLGGTAREVRAKFSELADRLDRTPIGEMDGPAFRYTNFAFLFSDSTFAPLADTWRAIDLTLGGHQPPGEINAPGPADFSGLIHLACNSSRWSRDVPTYQRDVERDRVRYPLFGASGANLWPCAFWPVEPVEAPVRITDHGPSNVLLLSNLRDPGTPLIGAAEMRRALGQRARLVAVDAGGHLAYLADGNACVDDLTTGFLVDGQRPRTDRFCAANGASSEPLSRHQRNIPELRE